MNFINYDSMEDQYLNEVYNEMEQITCPKCKDVLTVDYETAATFNRLKNLGKMELLYWKVDHRCK